MTEKRLCTIDSCDYCPFFECIKVEEKSIRNDLIDADFYKCNKLQICVEANKVYLPNAKEHLFSLCPLEKVKE